MRLGLDLSAAAPHAVLVDEQGRVQARADAPTRADPSTRAEASASLAAATAAVLADLMSSAAAPLTRAGVARADAAAGLPAELAEAWRTHVPHLADPPVMGAGAAMVTAEQRCGAARGLAHVVALSTGDHVIGGVMVGGRVWSGAHGLAGSVGWLSLNPVEREDYRRLGGLAADVSAGGIVRRVVWRVKAGDHSTVVEQAGGDLARITVTQVFEHARSGDGLAVSVIRDTAKYVGMAVSNLVAVLDPQVVVLGGLLADFGDLLLEPIRVECARRLSPAQAERLQVVLTPLGHDSVAIGAAIGAERPGDTGAA